MQTRRYIGGLFVDGLACGTIEVVNSADGTVPAEIAGARAEDIDRALAAARQAFPAWTARPTADRGRLLLALADAAEEHPDELARLESLDTGHPIRDSSRLDVLRTAAAYRYFGGMAGKCQGSITHPDQPVSRGLPCEPGQDSTARPAPPGQDRVRRGGGVRPASTRSRYGARR